MSKGPEGRYIDKIHRALNDSVYHVSMTNPYIGGIPDIYYEGAGKCLWIEYKALEKLPKRLDCTKLCTANQLSWLRRAQKNHGNVAVIVGMPDGSGVMLRNLSWEVIQNTSKLKQYTPKEIAQKITSYVETST